MKSDNHKIFQAIVYEINNNKIKAFDVLTEEYWRTLNQRRRFLCICRLVSLKNHCYGDKRVDFYNIILSYKQKGNLLRPAGINKFLDVSAATTQAFCFYGHQKLAFDHLKYDFKQISFQGKSKISSAMGVNIELLCKLLSVDKITDIVRNTICRESLEEISIYRFQDFYFGFFFFSFDKIEKFLSEEEKRRFAIVSVFGRSRFEYSLYFKAEAFVMAKILSLFPIKGQRRMIIFQKKMCIMERKLGEW